MKDFVAAAAPALKKGIAKNEEDAVTFNHEDTPVKFYKPASAQMGVLLMLMNGIKKDQENITPEQISSIMQFFFGMMDSDTGKYFETRMLNRLDPLSDISAPNGMLDIIAELTKEWSGKASAKQPASKTPRPRTGRSSTDIT